ncbi:restriction endonuclease subunit S [Natronosalvus caseinilyticus]|uniref:restriction endonuclease subunit S n=1 Tax=Natronosalvus caseinilyticus TaxID=2953747 RepID=UPI0028A5BBAC|nr:restriction endonuclease subunit S [Natronosalvus caseinilyticus]
MTSGQFSEKSLQEGYKFAQLGPKSIQIPKEWCVTKISEISEVKYGKSLPDTGGEIPAVGSSGLYDYVNKSLIDDDTIVIGRKGSAGEAYLLREPCWPSDTAFYLSEFKHDKIDLGFVYHHMSLHSLSDELEQTSIPSLDRNRLENYQMPAPPLSEQQQITNILSVVDQEIQQTDEIIEKTEELKRGLRNDLIINGLTHKEYQPFRVGPFDFKIPSSWDVCTVSECVDNLDSQRIPVKKTDREEMEGDIPYYGASGQIDTVDDWLFNDELLLLAEDGENLLSRNKPISFKVSGKSWVNNHAHVLKPNSDMSLVYLLNYFEVLSYEPYATGTAQPKLNQKVLNSLKVPKPPKSEQDEIADVLNQVTAKIEQEYKRRTILQELKRGLMQDLLTGKVRVNINN